MTARMRVPLGWMVLVLVAGVVGGQAAQVRVAWDAPTNNTDGTLLTDLAGYKLYYGTASANYTFVTNVGNVCTALVANLTEGQTYYFAAKSYNALLSESAYSTELVYGVPDTTAPSLAPPAAQTVAIGSTTNKAPLPNLAAGAVVSDNVSPVAGITVTQLPLAGSASGVGVVPVTITARDQAGNSTQAVVQVTFVDVTAPSITPPAAQTLAVGSTTNKAILPNLVAGAVVSDNVSPVAGITVTQAPVAGTAAGLGVTTVTLSARDQAGNTTQASVQVTVVDVTAPVIAAPAPVTLTGNADDLAAVPDFLAGLVVSDNCTAPAGIVKSQSPVAGTLVPVGASTVTIRATDAAGNQAQTTVSVTVERANRAPVVNAGPNPTIRVNQTASLSGSVTDDGLPAGATVTVGWTKVSGPGAVTFGSASEVVTTVSFGATGSYTLRLTASDTLLAASDDVVITVQPAPIPGAPANIRVNAAP